MQFSLRTFLIGICISGLSLGLLGALFRQNPELFMAVVLGATTIGPFLLAIGTLIWLGLRRHPLGMEPLCGQCRHAVSVSRRGPQSPCPTCGVDLTDPQAILFRRRERSRSLAAWGGLLLVAPLIGVGVTVGLRWYAGSSRPNMALQSTAQLLQQLPNQIDAPWTWQELERRLKAKSLSSQEVDEAVTALVRFMTTKSPTGWKRSLSWQAPFLQAATQRGMISEPVLLRLCDAFYGTQPTIEPLPRLREGQKGLHVSLEYGNPFSSHTDFGVVLVWQVSRVLLDGKPIQLGESARHNNRWSGFYRGALPVGDHELALELECAYIDQKQLTGISIDDYPPARWPQARKRWKQTVSAPRLTIYPADVPLVRMTTDAGRNPGSDGGVQVQRLVVINAAGKKQLRLKLAAHEGLPVPISYDITLAFSGRKVPCGAFWAVQKKNGSASSGEQLERELDAFDPAITAVDLILTPNPQRIERQPHVSEIWGQPTILRDVPLERLDLDPGTPVP